MHDDSDPLSQETLSLSEYFSHSYKDGLNDQQLEAVNYPLKPLLVLAGAGTGKTKVLTTRIATTIQQESMPAWAILAVTFTNKAANEMRERIAHMIGDSSRNIWLGTFHSLAGRMLRRHADKAGLRDNFTIIDDGDQLRLIKTIYKDLGLDDKKLSPKSCLYYIGRWKDKLYGPNNVPAEEIATCPDRRVEFIYKEYNTRLLALNAVDFSDLLYHIITIFKNNDDILQYWQQKFRMILVDEYQDTNSAQYYWLRLLAQRHQNITCVGDDDQSIYGWRGAEIDNILKFEHDFKGAYIIRLEENYRSTPQILAAASSLIHNNQKRLGKKLWTDSQDGDNIHVHGHYNNDMEAEEIASDILRKMQQHVALNNIAILMRTSAQSRALENKLSQQAIDYKVIGGAKFYEREEIRDIIAYLRILYQEFDGLAFARIINKPNRTLGLKAQEKIAQYAQIHGVSYMQSLNDHVQQHLLNKKQHISAEQFLAVYHNALPLRKELDIDMVRYYIDSMGVVTHYKNLPKTESEGKLQNIQEFYIALSDFTSLEAFLEHVSLVTDTSDTKQHDCVSIMTIHAAKGLEFDHVYVSGVEEGLFPNQRALDEQGNIGLEEERRLAYVAFTRARKTLSLHFAQNRRSYGNNWVYAAPSRFLDELPKNTTTVTLDPNLVRQYNHDISINYNQSHNDASSTSYNKAKTVPKTTQYIHKIGDNIMHNSFGHGVIIDMEGDIAHIMFDEHGEKRILCQFINPL